MKTNPQPGSVRRLHIQRLDLDLRGMAPRAAEATARLLRPALAQALAGRRIEAISAKRVDAGRIALTGVAVPHTVAHQLAQRIADTLREG
jgi:hypothetical protein